MANEFKDETILNNYDKITKNGNMNHKKYLLFLADSLVMTLAIFVPLIFYPNIIADANLFFLSLGLLIINAFMLGKYKLYRHRNISDLANETKKIIQAISFSYFLFLFYISFQDFEVDPYLIAITYFLNILFLLVFRLGTRIWFSNNRKKGKNNRDVLIIGKGQEAELIVSMLETDPSLGYTPKGYLRDYWEKGEINSDNVIEAHELIIKLGFNGVVIASSNVEAKAINILVRMLTEDGIHVEMTSILCDIAPERLLVRPLGRLPMAYIEPVKRSGWRLGAKSIFDVALASLIFLSTLPVLIFSMAIIKITSPGPAFFKQTRVGLNGERFEILKLRTMGVDAEEKLKDIQHLNEEDGPIFKIKDDPRITKIGKILRKTSIDELPQVINVLKREMSIVGPRPALPSEADKWEPHLHNRLKVLPGITGMWQISGRVDENNETEFGQLDLYYVDNWKLSTDVGILIKTVPVVILQKGSY